MQEYARDLFAEQRKQFRGHQQLAFDQTTAVAVHRSACSLVERSDSGSLLQRCKTLACKKCYIWGEENKDMPVLRQLDFVEKNMIPDSGHAMMTGHAELFYPVVAMFIKSCIIA